MKLNILGTKYDLKYIDNPDEDMQTTMRMGIQIA